MVNWYDHKQARQKGPHFADTFQTLAVLNHWETVAHRASKPPETHSKQRWEACVSKEVGQGHTSMIALL